MRLARFLPLLALLILTPARAESTPASVVSAFQNLLLDNMRQGAALSCDARQQRLLPSVENTFDLPYLAQHILRPHWAELNDAQKGQFTETLQDMVVATYASQFARSGGETFTMLDTDDMAGNLRVVHARLEPKSGDPVRFDYVMHETPKGWRVINVIAAGVSDLALRSAQYNRVIKDKGFDGLIGQIREKTAQTKTSCS